VQIRLPTGDAVDAFSDVIERLTGGHGQILLAVSGGPDSLAMLLLAASACPDRVAAATVDHQLRNEAAEEADYVAAICADLGIPHNILRPETAITGNIQAKARAARYALLAAQADASGCRWIATAHHADDQLETILMRVARGSGIDGLSAIRVQNDQIIRPLLGFAKEQLERICEAAAIVPVRDPSNDDAEFDRVAMRKWLADTSHPFDPVRAVRSAAALDEAAQALDWMTDRLASTHIEVKQNHLILDPFDLPDAIKRRLALRVLRQIEPDIAPRGEAMDRLLFALEKGERMTLGSILCEGGDSWSFSPAPPRRN
jgi:tRNA(Ile)-lysidine synthase